MRTFFISLILLTMSIPSFAGFIVFDSQMKPYNSQALPFYTAYQVSIEQVNPYPVGWNDYIMTIKPYVVCQSQCPRIILPPPSRLVVNQMYYDRCSAYNTFASVLPNAPFDIRQYQMIDYTNFNCFPRPISQLSATITHANGQSEYLFGIRIR